MKQILSFIFFLILSLTVKTSAAQDLDNAGEYMTAVSKAQSDMDKKYMAYMSASAHSSRKRKVEKLRLQALESINISREKTAELPIYKKDNSLRQSSMDYIKLCYSVFNEDYDKIVNMEDIAEQSFDAMQSYILLQDKTNEKVKEAVDKMNNASKAFAAKYNVNIINEQSDLGEKLSVAGNLNRYRNNVYLIFFKCNWQDGEIVKALNAGKLTDAEQGRTSLIRFADEGLLGLDSLKKFDGDVSLANACKQVLQFYKKMAETDLPKQMDFFLKQENFNKMKKAFEAKSDHNKQEVDLFNAAVKDVNKASDNYNQVNNTTNATRHTLLQNWTDAEKAFGDAHMPYYK